MTPEAVVLGSLTIPGCPEHVARARAFVARLAGAAAETAVLLTSELVTNALLYTRSGRGGVVTVVVLDLPDGLLVEVADDGSPDRGPGVSGDRYAACGHGLFLVEQLAARWGYRRDRAGTTVWFHVGTGTARRNDRPPRACAPGWLAGGAGNGDPARNCAVALPGALPGALHWALRC